MIQRFRSLLVSRLVTRLGILLVLLLSLVVVGQVTLTQTDLVPQLVDTVRNLPFVGPDRMAALENAFYTVQDTWNQFVYDQTHTAVVVSRVSGNAKAETRGSENASQAVSDTVPQPQPQPTLAPVGNISLAPSWPTPAAGGVRVLARPGLPTPIAPLILSDIVPGEGIWSAVGFPLDNSSRPPLQRTVFRPDPERPYARTDLVWIDTSQTQLTIVQGTVEPRPIKGGPHGLGMIPQKDQASGRLIAAWNGGFLTVNGQYGMMVNRQVVLPPRDGFATLGQYRNGEMRIGVWGRDITYTPDLVTFRQNGPILIDRGQLNEDGMLAWGKSVSGETHIWRSGIGLTRDGALIYAAGNALSAQTLGQALLAAGAVEAMQLDVNAWHVYFFSYEQVGDALVGTKLNAGMAGNNKTFLVPHDRDFMYLMLKGGAANNTVPTDPLLTP